MAPGKRYEAMVQGIIEVNDNNLNMIFDFLFAHNDLVHSNIRLLVECLITLLVCSENH